MGKKRKAHEADDVQNVPPEKKSRASSQKKDDKSNLIFAPCPDWHAAQLPPLDYRDVTGVPPQHTVGQLRQYADSLLEAENKAYNTGHLSGSSSHKFLSTIMSSGTLEDKISALTLLVQESPLHTMKAFENLIGLSKKKSRNQALMALAALKDLLGQGVVLPSERKLRPFEKQPLLLGALQQKGGKWSEGDALPGSLQKVHLIVWAYEDWLKRTYFEVLQVLENWCGDGVEHSRSRAVTYVWELLRDKPEQEENLLRLLVNKLGDTDRKIASRASYLLLQLENTHPAMKMVITNSIEADCLFRPGQSLHAKYYATVTLNQTILSQKEQEIANKLLGIYFSLFIHLLKPVDKQPIGGKSHISSKVQGGGGKAGKMAAKKQKLNERSEESDDQLREKMTAQVLTGVNRAFPFADTSDPTFESKMDAIFRVTHSANFNTAIQALMLIQQISSTKHYGAERFYRTLYESLLDPRLLTSSKQVLYLNLLYKSLKADLNAKRVQAFVKRLMQIITMHEPPFACGVLYLISELEGTFPSIKNMVTEPEMDNEDEEEHFVDAPEENEDAQEAPKIQPSTSGFSFRYDPKKRDPVHAHADRSCLWELLPFLQHFHPSVSLFAESLILSKQMPPKPDPTQHTLMHFLDRFVYRSARSKATASMHGSSIMQPMAGSNAADLLVQPGKGSMLGSGALLNSEAFWQKKVEDVAADEVFFHSYFNQAGYQKRNRTEKKKHKGEEDRDEDEGADEGEEEIWKAITSSKADVEGPDDDDDISLGDLESAYSDSESGSDAGIDLGGDDGQDGESTSVNGLVLDDDPEGGEEDELLELESGDEDAMFDSEDDVPVDAIEGPESEGDDREEVESSSKKKRREKKKFKQLPTFASAEDYAKLLGDDDDEY